MALIRWEPFREVDTLQREMNRLFDRLAPEVNHTAFAPAAEMQETSEAIQLKIEVPGIAAKDLDVQVTAEAVSVSGERKATVPSEERAVFRSEFRYGRFQRVIPLPTRVQNTQVQAEFKNGILHLHLPKAEEERNKVVKVNLAG
ncbi:Hsp20/alpha crystallin family protein [Trichocoleus sp. FACHB-262]|uniref:Hsp20/alpha crystallin family protein n=1 Tax=Trichocoleus sp. FACHB-262 TaxID=2692869 RepID=UPI0016864345|nr:Hsp20/alpha crystallin family protein [Trichocoleus sp. FACHB-262]MBD2122129.1 Hsp20/alpha crystallin family protein [Trichocoleus sp. FACHB-262]